MAERWVRGTQISERRRCNVQVSSLFSRYLFLNIFPLALSVYPCSSLHLSNSLGLFFSCSNADATASAPGMFGSVATEKHVSSYTHLGSVTSRILPTYPSRTWNLVVPTSRT